MSKPRAGGSGTCRRRHDCNGFQLRGIWGLIGPARRACRAIRAGTTRHGRLRGQWSSPSPRPVVSRATWCRRHAEPAAAPSGAGCDDPLGRLGHHLCRHGNPAGRCGDRDPGPDRHAREHGGDPRPARPQRTAARTLHLMAGRLPAGRPRHVADQPPPGRRPDRLPPGEHPAAGRRRGDDRRAAGDLPGAGRGDPAGHRLRPRHLRLDPWRSRCRNSSSATS